MSHDEIARSLAGHLRGPARMVWCNMQLGPVGSLRPDVYTINKSYSHPSPVAYEVKFSRADFLADVTTGKWQTYLSVACGVYFACVAGLLTKADVPTHCGLMVRHQSGAWRAAKRAVLSPVALPQDAMLKLLIDGVEREGPAARRKTWMGMDQHDLKRRFGETVAKAVRNAEAVEHQTNAAANAAVRIVAAAEATAAAIRKDAETEIEPQRVALCDALGIPTNTSIWQIRGEVSRVRSEMEKHPAQRKLELAVRVLRSALQQLDPETGARR